MGKRGGSNHLKRMAAPKALYLSDKKRLKWVVKPSPGPHKKDRCIPLGVLLRDFLKIAKTMREAKKILNKNFVKVDGVVRKDEKFPVGLMDVIYLVPTNEYYRILVDWKGRLQPVRIEKDVNLKVGKVVKKNLAKKGKIVLTTHDGRNTFGDNHISVGDSIIFELPSDNKGKQKIIQHLKLQNGARCFIYDGKHAGKFVTVKEIIEAQKRRKEAVVNDGKSDFITVLDYLIVVDDKFEVKL